MEKYTGDKAICPKCGNKKIGTKYSCQFRVERMFRDCQTCGYGWAELPIDHKEQKINKKDVLFEKEP